MCSSRRAGRLKTFSHPLKGHDRFLWRQAGVELRDAGVNDVAGVSAESSSSGSESDVEFNAGSGDSIFCFLLDEGSEMSRVCFAVILPE